MAHPLTQIVCPHCASYKVEIDRREIDPLTGREMSTTVPVSLMIAFVVSLLAGIVVSIVLGALGLARTGVFNAVLAIVWFGSFVIAFAQVDARRKAQRAAAERRIGCCMACGYRWDISHL